jgi:toxin ParE1/3/4
MGRLVDVQSPLLQGLRRWRIKAFTDYLIFYQVNQLRIAVLRVVHGARDLAIIFAEMEEDETNS